MKHAESCIVLLNGFISSMANKKVTSQISNLMLKYIYTSL